MPGRGTNPVDEKYVTAAIAKDMRTETDDGSEEPLRLPAEVRSEDPLGHAMPASSGPSGTAGSSCTAAAPARPPASGTANGVTATRARKRWPSGGRSEPCCGRQRSWCGRASRGASKGAGPWVGGWSRCSDAHPGTSADGRRVGRAGRTAPSAPCILGRGLYSPQARCPGLRQIDAVLTRPRRSHQGERLRGDRPVVPGRLPLRPVSDAALGRGPAPRSRDNWHAAGHPPWPHRGDPRRDDRGVRADRHGRDRLREHDAAAVNRREISPWSSRVSSSDSPAFGPNGERSTAGRPEGLAVEEHVTRLREQIMPLVERFNRMGREGIEALGRARQAPSLAVERAEAINIVLVASAGG